MFNDNGSFLLALFEFFLFFAWFMCLFWVISDIFRSKDLSGVAKTFWVFFVIILAAVIAYQMISIFRAVHPAAKAVEALCLTGPLFLLLFASTYFLMSQADSANFNLADLTRSDSLYFTVTVFTTVGFGDILATSHSARTLVTVQMILDLILIGAVIRAFVEAVKMARETPHAPSPEA